MLLIWIGLRSLRLFPRLGLDKNLLKDILSHATGRCWSLDTYNPVPGVMENVPSANEYKVSYC